LGQRKKTIHKTPIRASLLECFLFSNSHGRDFLSGNLPNFQGQATRYATQRCFAAIHTSSLPEAPQRGRAAAPRLGLLRASARCASFESPDKPGVVTDR
jgi:hypothetical protein